MISSSRSRTLVTLALACLLGCSESAKEKEPRDTTARRPDEGAAPKKPSAPTPAAPPFRVMTFERGAIPKEYIYQGQLLGGARWMDLNGDNTLLVSQKIVAAEEGSKQEIFAYTYVTKEGTTKLLWKIQDAAENWCDQGDGLVSDIMVLDLDGDEIAENAFVYNIQGSCDVSPRTFKLMLHSGATKYAVRGTNVVKAPETMGGEKKFDPAFDKAPKDFKQFADEMWAKYVR